MERKNAALIIALENALNPVLALYEVIDKTNFAAPCATDKYFSFLLNFVILRFWESLTIFNISWSIPGPKKEFIIY